MILLIDNYDSFTYNLYHIAAACGEVKVVKNDEITAAQVFEMNPSHILISPGPCRPQDAGNILDIIDKCKGKIPMFGVCLGHQAIGEVFGATLDYAEKLLHGVAIDVTLDTSQAIFANMAQKITGARYNSLELKADSLPDCLKLIATGPAGEVMGIRHKEYEIYGVQFHPESILTDGGDAIVTNFLNSAR